ncbi:hypothetical protein OF83DRAFT_1033568, partial [Amylostereum chailletii]
IFITQLLFSSPRIRFSEAQKLAVLDWARQLQAPDVPTMYALEKCQKDLLALLGDPVTKFVSGSGNVSFVNAIKSGISKDYLNPLTRYSMPDYPEDMGGGMSQVYHSSKLLEEMPTALVHPNVRVRDKIFYVEELLQQESGAYFIPERFFYARDDSDHV